jgi:hypothetical protein
MEMSRYCFPIPDLMGDCKGSGGVISSPEQRWDYLPIWHFFGPFIFFFP